MNLLDLGNEMLEYTSRLPGISLEEIRNTSLEIWGRQSDEMKKEDWGSFQAFDASGNIFFGGDKSKELEQNLNDQFLEDGYGIKLAVRQTVLSVPLPFYSSHRMATQTYEIVVLDNPISEAQDKAIDKMIEDRLELEQEGV